MHVGINRAVKNGQIPGVDLRFGGAGQVFGEGSNFPVADSDVLRVVAENEIEITHSLGRTGVPQTRNRLTPPSG